jgi:hypothetical protein
MEKEAISHIEILDLRMHENAILCMQCNAFPLNRKEKIFNLSHVLHQNAGLMTTWTHPSPISYTPPQVGRYKYRKVMDCAEATAKKVLAFIISLRSLSNAPMLQPFWQFRVFVDIQMYFRPINVLIRQDSWRLWHWIVSNDGAKPRPEKKKPAPKPEKKKPAPKPGKKDHREPQEPIEPKQRLTSCASTGWRIVLVQA